MDIGGAHTAKEYSSRYRGTDHGHRLEQFLAVPVINSLLPTEMRLHLGLLMYTAIFSQFVMPYLLAEMDYHSKTNLGEAANLAKDLAIVFSVLFISTLASDDTAFVQAFAIPASIFAGFSSQVAYRNHMKILRAEANNS